ncbi:MAG: ABC-three component system protein, partial [Candidatus Saccharimonadales bacterium]
DLLRVVRIMHPNESAGNRNLNKDGLKQVVLKVISEVTSQLEGAECVKLDSSSSSLILTTITNLNQEDAGSSRVAANRIIKTISEEGDVASLFTRSKIINKSLNSSFLDLADVDPETGRIAGKDYEDISTYAPLEFISANNAILELNEDAT